MRKHTLDNKKVSCPNATYSGVHDKLSAKRGDGILFHKWQGSDDSPAPVGMGRVLGRIATCDTDGQNCVGWLAVMELSDDGYGVYLRWVNPLWVRSVFTLPQKVPAFFFAAEMPAYDKLVYLMEKGSLHEFYIEDALKTTTATKDGSFDAICAKVKASGYASLTREEAKIFDSPYRVRPAG